MPFAPRPLMTWQLRTRALEVGKRTLVMGVLNVTPDSFSDGGLYSSADATIAAGLRMFEEGAAILDIGGESTRPGIYARPSAGQEADRVLPVIAGVLRARPDALISIDTYHASTAREAVTAGAEIVNDVSGLLWDPSMAATCAELGCGVVLMHTRGRPEEWRSLPDLAPNEVVPLIVRDLTDRVTHARQSGIDPRRLVLDPGFGFGKAFDENYPILAHLEEIRTLGLPVVAGVSRKGFLGRTLAPLRGGRDATVAERGNATIAAVTASILGGADIVRVHDVRSAVEAAAIADAVLSTAS
jgi:dihydropteroate synthase